MESAAPIPHRPPSPKPFALPEGPFARPEGGPPETAGGPGAGFLPPRVRALFPVPAGAAEVYLDSAATTQKPLPVIEVVREYHAVATANAARGTYPWATALTRRIAGVRERFAEFVGARSEEIVFTGGATAALNAVALAWGLGEFRNGDEILYSPDDHAANVHPWYLLRDTLARFGRRIRLVPYRHTDQGAADIADIGAKAGERTRLVTVTALHHVFGGVTDLAAVRARLPERVLLCADCSQSGGHLPVDLGGWGVDFAAFAGHKMFGSPGIGVLYCRRRTHAGLRPFLPGGTTTVQVERGELVVGAMPGRLEGGTPNLPGILSLGAALEVLAELGMPAVAAHNRALTERLVAGLRGVTGVDFLPGPGRTAGGGGAGIVSFTLAGISAGDLGFVLAEHGFLVRTGKHCVPGDGAESVRVSTQVYTTAAEIDLFVDRVRTIAQEVG